MRGRAPPCMKIAHSGGLAAIFMEVQMERRSLLYVSLWCFYVKQRYKKPD
jgi:hypothetical protein